MNNEAFGEYAQFNGEIADCPACELTDVEVEVEVYPSMCPDFDADVSMKLSCCGRVVHGQ